MARRLMVHMCAERERSFARGTAAPRPSRHGAATGLINVLVGLWPAPVSHPWHP
ncbi:hypothetical protein ACWGDX_21290 [Streptomyces sp. NPDC055025]